MAATAKSTVQKTAYHVLRLVTPPITGTNDPNSTRQAARHAGYELVHTEIEAHNAAAAIRAHAEALGGDATGTYVAVPSRSWKPTPVTVETTTQIKLGDT